MDNLDPNIPIQIYSQKLAEAQHQIIVLTAMIEQLKKEKEVKNEPNYHY